jgi:hypothetical protein
LPLVRTCTLVEGKNIIRSNKAWRTLFNLACSVEDVVDHVVSGAVVSGVALAHTLNSSSNTADGDFINRLDVNDGRFRTDWHASNWISKERKHFLDVSPSRWASFLTQVLAFTIIVRGQICLVTDAFLELLGPLLIPFAANWDSDRVPELPGVFWTGAHAGSLIEDKTVDASGINAAEEGSVGGHHLALAVWARATVVKRLERGLVGAQWIAHAEMNNDVEIHSRFAALSVAELVEEEIRSFFRARLLAEKIAITSANALLSIPAFTKLAARFVSGSKRAVKSAVALLVSVNLTFRALRDAILSIPG